MPGGWSSIHPDMQAALESVGITEEQVLAGYREDPGEGHRSHRVEGEIDGHPFCSSVDLPWELRSPVLRRKLVEVGFAPFFLQATPTCWTHIHAVYVGARDHLGRVTALASTRQLILEFIRDKPLTSLVAEADRPTAEERAIVRARYEAWAPDPHTVVLAPSGKPIDCSPFIEPDRPGVIRCAMAPLASALKVVLVRAFSDPIAMVKGKPIRLPDVALRQEDPWDRVDLLPFVEGLGLQAALSNGPGGDPVVQLSGEAAARPLVPAGRGTVAGAQAARRKRPAAPEPPPPDDEFTRAYRELVGRLYRPLRPSDGLPEAGVVAAERRLGVKLPPALRAVYRLSGAFQQLHQEFHPLVLPGELEIEDGFLPVHDENQGVYQWSLRMADLGQSDPPVYGRPSMVGEEPQEWAVEHPHLSGFLLMMVYLQALESGLPHVAVEDVTPGVMERLAREWPLVSDGGRPDSGMRIYSAGRQVIRLFPDAPDMQLTAAAKTTKEFRDIGRRLGIELNEC